MWQEVVCTRNPQRSASADGSVASVFEGTVSIHGYSLAYCREHKKIMRFVTIELVKGRGEHQNVTICVECLKGKCQDSILREEVTS